MSDLVANPEDRFSHNEALIASVAEQSGLCLTSKAGYRIYGKRVQSLKGGFVLLVFKLPDFFSLSK